MKPINRFIAAACLAGTSGLASAQPFDAPAPVVTGPSWELAIRRLPEAELKQLYAHCGRVSEKRSLSTDEVLACSVAYDALLVGTFRGDYLALRAWSTQTHGRSPSASQLD